MRLLKTATLAVAILALTACYPLSSKHPLGGQKMDSALLGTWTDDGDDGTSLTFTREDRRTLRAVITDPDEDNGGMHYLIKPSLIGGKTYMSITQLFPRSTIEAYAADEEISFREAKRQISKRDSRMNGYYLGYYTITQEDDGERLELFLMDTDSEVVAADIEAGKISGGRIEVATGEEDGDTEEILYLTSSSRKLADYVLSYDEDPQILFDFDIVNMTRK